MTETAREPKTPSMEEIEKLLSLCTKSLETAVTEPLRMFTLGITSQPYQKQDEKVNETGIRMRGLTAKKLHEHLSGKMPVNDLSSPVLTRDDIEELMDELNHEEKPLWIEITDEINQVGLNSYEIALRELKAAQDFCAAHGYGVSKISPEGEKVLTETYAGQLVRAVYQRNNVEQTLAITMNATFRVNMPAPADEEFLEFMSEIRKMLDDFIKVRLDSIYMLPN